MTKSAEPAIRLRAHDIGLDDWNTSAVDDLRKALAYHDAQEKLAAKIVSLVRKAGDDGEAISRAQAMFRA